MSADVTASGREEAYLAGLRAGYEHGYDIGRAHGRSEVLIEPGETVPEFRGGGPTRAELIERGHIPRDTSRPPALPARLWCAEDWAKADERDLPTTDHGRAEWRAAIAGGRVPAGLVEAFAARERGNDRAERSTPPAAGSVRATVSDTGRCIAELRGQLAAAHRPNPARRDRQRTADVDRGRRDARTAELDEPELERGPR